jgi:hypothetical protein
MLASLTSSQRLVLNETTAVDDRLPGTVSRGRWVGLALAISTDVLVTDRCHRASSVGGRHLEVGAVEGGDVSPEALAKPFDCNRRLRHRC